LNNESPSLADTSAQKVSDLEMKIKTKKQEEFLAGSDNGIRKSIHNPAEQKIVFYFPFNSYLLNDTQLDSLKSYFGKLYKTNKVPLLRIEGHTDSKGTQEFNKNLSRKRARSVESAIKSSHLLLKNLNLIAMDESKPAALETTADGKDNEAGRQLNRRVEITVLIE